MTVNHEDPKTTKFTLLFASFVTSWCVDERGGSGARRGFRGVLGLFRELLECGGAGDRKLGQAFAIQRDTGPLEPADELTVGEPVLAGGGVDPHDPQSTEVTLLAPPAD